jgi:lysosomal acid lipase/cholesteryl ester hydrolase
MGVYDLPSEIDYILRWTGKEQLNYIGHSMGTTVFFVMASERPEYNSKIRQMHALAPVCYLSRMRSPLKFLTLFMDGYNVRLIQLHTRKSFHFIYF